MKAEHVFQNVYLSLACLKTHSYYFFYDNLSSLLLLINSAVCIFFLVFVPERTITAFYTNVDNIFFGII